MKLEAGQVAVVTGGASGIGLALARDVDVLAATTLERFGPAEEVGDGVVAGIRRGDSYILTHPPVREIVDERYQELINAFESQVPRFAGDEILDTRRLFRRRE